MHRFNHFFISRQLIALSTMWRLAYECNDARIRRFMVYMVRTVHLRACRIMAQVRTNRIFLKSTNI